jgi:hypothetical protein
MQIRGACFRYAALTLAALVSSCGKEPAQPNNRALNDAVQVINPNLTGGMFNPRSGTDTELRAGILEPSTGHLLVGQHGILLRSSDAGRSWQSAPKTGE